MYMNDEEPEFGGRPMGVMGGEEEEESSDEEPHTPEARTQWLIHHSCLSFMPIK